MSQTNFYVLLVVITFDCILILNRLNNPLIVECADSSYVYEAPIPLPEKCHPFYNDGTGRWAECMGVGPK